MGWLIDALIYWGQICIETTPWPGHLSYKGECFFCRCLRIQGCCRNMSTLPIISKVISLSDSIMEVGSHFVYPLIYLKMFTIGTKSILNHKKNISTFKVLDHIRVGEKKSGKQSLDCRTGIQRSTRESPTQCLEERLCWARDTSS